MPALVAQYATLQAQAPQRVPTRRRLISHSWTLLLRRGGADAWGVTISKHQASATAQPKAEARMS
jgi:hypothetical protein